MAKTRSPNFPYIPLKSALSRAQAIWEKEGRHSAAPETIVDHWGYSGKSSGGRQTLGALRHFGLLEGRAGNLRLTELAQSILVGEEGTDEWLRRVRESALKPAIHREVWSKYEGELPSDQNLRYYLVVERGFSESGAAELIGELRATFEYAQLGPDAPDSMSFDASDKLEAELLDETAMPEIPTPSRSPQATGARSVQIPYSASGWAVLQAPFPLSGPEWEQMLAVLQAMKAGLVSPDNA